MNTGIETLIGIDQTPCRGAELRLEVCGHESQQMDPEDTIMGEIVEIGVS